MRFRGVSLILGFRLGHLVIGSWVHWHRLANLRRWREQLGRVRELGQRILIENLWLVRGTGVRSAQLIEGGVAVRDVHNASGQGKGFQEFLGAAEGSQINGCDAGQHLTGDIGLDGQRDVAQVNVTLVAVRVVEGQIHAFLALETGVILAHLRQDSDLVDHRLDHIAGRKRRND